MWLLHDPQPINFSLSSWVGLGGEECTMRTAQGEGQEEGGRGGSTVLLPFANNHELLVKSEPVGSTGALRA